jgi:hypothetical protein
LFLQIFWSILSALGSIFGKKWLFS